MLRNERKDGGIESLIYLAFRSRITAALQANFSLLFYDIASRYLAMYVCRYVYSYGTNIL